MVLFDKYEMYERNSGRPATSDSRRHFATPSHDQAMDTPPYTQDAKTDKPTAKTSAMRMSQELSRIKPKPQSRPFDRFTTFCRDQSLIVRGVMVILLTSIPFVILCLVAYSLPHQQVGDPKLNVTLRRLAIWLTMCWGSFVGLLYCGRVLSLVLDYLCTLSTDLVRFRSLAREICLRITLLIWAGIGYAIMPELFKGASKNPLDLKIHHNWVAKLRKAFIFLMIAFAIILVQGILLQLIKIQYIEGFIGPRTAKACHELETIKDLNDLVSRHVAADDVGIVAKILRKVFMPINSRDLYYIISRGDGDEEKWKEYASRIWSTIANGKPYLTCEDLSHQLSIMNRDPAKGQQLFLQLDESLDGQVTEEEMTALVERVGLQINRRAQAMSGIKRLITKLEIVMSVLVLGLITFVYVQFFEQDILKNIGNLWTGIVGLAFAFSGAVSEFVNSTVFCFGKHPYDIGDYVEIKTKKYIVSQIFLTHTNFEQVQNEFVRGLACQMSHASLQTEPIINWTRTVDDAVKRHADSESKGKEKTDTREDNIANLVLTKLEYLHAVSPAQQKIKQDGDSQ